MISVRGTLLLVQAINGRVQSAASMAVCSALLTLLVIARMADLIRRVQSNAAQLLELALEDPLTGLDNRWAMGMRLPHH